MTRKEAVAAMKSRIKELAAEQKEEKKITHQNHEEYHAKWNAWYAQIRAMGKYVWDVKDRPRTLGDVFYSVHSRCRLITAFLNVYNEARGKTYRHVKRDDLERAQIEELEEEIRCEFADAFTSDQIGV